MQRRIFIIIMIDPEDSRPSDSFGFSQWLKNWKNDKIIMKNVNDEMAKIRNSEFGNEKNTGNYEFQTIGKDDMLKELDKGKMISATIDKRDENGKRTREGDTHNIAIYKNPFSKKIMSLDPQFKSASTNKEIDFKNYNRNNQKLGSKFEILREMD